MTKNDLLLLAILAIGACWINWNIIKRDFFHTNSSASRTTKQRSSNEKEMLEEHLP